MPTSIDTAEDAPLFLLAGQAFLSSDLGELKNALLELENSGRLPASPALAEWQAALSVDPLALHKEYVRLFVNPSGAPCPPWQSVHGDQPVLMGDSHHSAVEWYREAGLEPRLDSEPGDHIGLLLSFYGHLLAEPAGEDRLARFHAEHLQWIPAFCSRLESEARLEFYRLLARLVSETVSLSSPD